MKLVVAAIIIFSTVSAVPIKTPGEALDTTLKGIENNITTLGYSLTSLTLEYQELKNDVESLKMIHRPCAPCLELKGSHPHCDCTSFEAKKDCLEFHEDGFRRNGIHKIEGERFTTITAYCDQTTQGGGWTVIQRRQDGSVDFDRTWNDYKNGFGKLAGELWLGNEKIHYLTKKSNSPNKSQLLINLKIHGTNKQEYVKYSSFEISDEESKYTLSISGFSGTMARDTMAYHNDAKFTTKDQDNDIRGDNNCAIMFSGGWWHKNCFDANLNGKYGFTNDTKELVYRYHGKIQPNFVEMKIRRNKIY